MSIARFDRARWPFGLALVIAAVTRLVFPFDGLYGQDGFAYFRFARAIWPHFLHGAPLPDLYWPRGYPAAVALLLPIAGGGPMAGQLVSALASAWAAAATFLLVREAELRRGAATDPTARLVAGICVASSGVALRTSQVVMADALGLGLAATALWCAARYLRSRSGRWLVPCAVALAWGAVTRWQVGLLAIPIGAALAICGFDRSGEATTPFIERNVLRVWWLAAALAGLLVLGPQIIVAHTVPHSLAQHEWLERWNLLNALHRDFHTTEGDAHYHLPVGLFYLVRLGWPDALFPTIAVLATVGTWTIVRERRAVELAMLVGWPLLNWVFISGIPYENPRFLWPTLPAIAALVGLGFRTTCARIGARARSRLVLVFVGSIILGLGLGGREHAHTVARKNADRALVDWIDAQVPAGTTLFRSGGTLMSEYYGSTKIRDVSLLTPNDLGGLLAHDCPCFYLKIRDEVEGQWVGRSPQALFDALRMAPGLTAIASRYSFTIFRVGPDDSGAPPPAPSLDQRH